MYYDSNGNPHVEERTANAPAAGMVKVCWWMTFALAVSGLCAWIVGSSQELTKFLIRNPITFVVLMIAEFGLVIGINAGIKKLSAATASALFILYSALNGITLSVIFLVYTTTSIVQVFGITAATFAVTATFGAVTKRDLTGIGNLLVMALFGLIIASVVNIFWANDTLYWICSYAGVVIFVGLTAYDAQKIKRAYLATDPGDTESVGRIAVVGALELYLDFVNLFLYLLRILGRRR